MSARVTEKQYAIAAEFYDYVTPYVQRADVDFFVEESRRSGGPVLELGCGTGRILLPTAAAGFDVVGLDAAPAMLQACRRKLEGVPAEVRGRIMLVEADMRASDLGRTFRLITVPFRGFQHLQTVADQLACLECVRRHLAPEGRFILDVFDPWLEKLAASPDPDRWEDEPAFTMPDGRRVLRRVRLTGRNLAAQTFDAEFLYEVTHPDGRRESLREAFRLRYFFRFELEHLLARTGFRVEEIYCDYDRSPPGAKVPGELIFTTRRD